MNRINNGTPKLLILGSARHGKDTFAEILRDRFFLEFKSSSQAAADIFIYKELKDKYGYTTPEECFEDRMNHRQEWYEMICDYNKDDRARLAKDILSITDCYVGMRDRDEINECMEQGLFDIIIWVDASDRLPLEGAGSFNIDRSCADIVLENNGTLEEFVEKTTRLGKIIFQQEPFIKDEPSGGFLELFKSKMMEEAYEIEDGVLEIDIDIFNFTDNVRIHGWPKVEGEILSLENWGILSIDDNGMELKAGGDWQCPQVLTIKYDGENVFVESYRPLTHPYNDLSENQIKEILGIEVPNEK